jgi:cytosine/adenosine deaminase-related metal-dependent hydrolase
VTTAISADWVLPVDGPPLRDAFVAWEDGRIVDVASGRAGRHYEGCAILPGLVNAHTHLEYAVYAGFGDGLAFAPWLALHIARKARLEVEEMEAIALLGALQCLRSGVTTVGDASFSGAAATACAAAGLRAIVYLEVFGPDASQMVTRFEANAERVRPAFSDRVRLGISPHSTYSASLELWEAAAATGLPMATHLAESEGEGEWVRSRSGPFADVMPGDLAPSSIGELAERGLLSPRLTAAHCVTVDAAEIELLARHGLAAVHCPRGVRVGLGTDSPASTPSFDLFDELRAAIFSARARERRADAISAADALRLATLDGATALGLEHEVGSLTAGKRADLAVLSLAGSPYDPVEDPTVAVVFGGAPASILETIVGGKTRYRQGETTWPEVLSTASAARRRMLA